MSSVGALLLITVLVCAGLFCFASVKAPLSRYSNATGLCAQCGTNTPRQDSFSHVAQVPTLLTSDLRLWPGQPETTESLALQMKWTGARQPKIRRRAAPPA